MSEQQNTDSLTASTDQAVNTDEAQKQVLRGRLDKMGIKYSNNAGIDRLREQLNQALDGDRDGANSKADDSVPSTPPVEQTFEQKSAPVVPKVKVKTIRQHLYDEKMKLVRCRITCLDPKKKDLQGEIITVGNAYLGTVSKFVPFGEATDDGTHIPFCIYEFLRDRKFVDIRTGRKKGSKQLTQSSREVREFAIEILDPLTPAELDDLRRAQLAAAG